MPEASQAHTISRPMGTWRGGSKMSDKIDDSPNSAEKADKAAEAEDTTAQARRLMLRRLGRFAAVTAPTATLLLATTKLAKASP